MVAINGKLLIATFGIFFLAYACKKKAEDDSTPTPVVETPCNLETINDNSTIIGYGILEKLPGIWNGAIQSPTPLGNFPEWIVDFRPVSASQVSSKNELDSLNDIFMSFFVTKINCEYKIAFRNGGGFAGQVRNAYMVCDSLNEGPTESYYRFSDAKAGKKRVYTDLTFKDDSLIMHTYTNKYNSLSTPVTHMIWRAKLNDITSAQNAISTFSFPAKTLVRDFSSTFNNVSEAVYYSVNDDPYPENEQPYLGKANINISISNPPSVNPNKKVVIIITTQPLFNGTTFLPANLKYRSRYVFVGAGFTTGYSFNYMHPGTYYVNAIYDENGDGTFSSGDYMNSSFDAPFTLSAEGNSTKNVNINFHIP